MKFKKIPFLLLFFFNAFLSSSQNLQQGFATREVAQGIENITSFCFLPDSSILVSTQEGKIFHVVNGAVGDEPILRVPTVLLPVGDRGLIAINVDPDFKNSPYIYTTYTTEDIFGNVVSRFKLEKHQNSYHIDLESEEVLLKLSKLNSRWHVGGSIVFDSLGYLYTTTGDNSSPNRSQDSTSTHGKVLRIYKDGKVPIDNPYFTGSDYIKDRIWAMGLRNPYSAAMQIETSKYFVNDVGKDTWEEINDASKMGTNFGWPFYEGNGTYKENFNDPYYAYSHPVDVMTDTNGVAITGGDFYPIKGGVYPDKFWGKYFFIDIGGGWINYIDPDSLSGVEVFATSLQEGVVGLKVGPDGCIYYSSRGENKIYKIQYNSDPHPRVVQQLKDTKTLEGSRTYFQVTATGEPDLIYKWFRNGQQFGTNRSKINFATSLNHEGKYWVSVSNSLGTTYSDTVTLEVYTINDIPKITILSPLADEMYSAGDTIFLAATAIDNQDGLLSGNAFTWWADFHHDIHIHDSPPVLKNDKGYFYVFNSGETASNVWFNFKVKVVDSDGFESFSEVQVYPNKSNVNFLSSPVKAKISVDGGIKSAPFTGTYVSKILLPMDAEEFIPLNNDTVYYFNQWSYGNKRESFYEVPEGESFVIANYVPCTTPDTPSGLTHFVDLNNGKLFASLTWDPMVCQRAFVIERSIENGPFVKIDSVVGEYTFIDENLIPEKNYHYRITAYNHLGGSNVSNIISLLTPMKLELPTNFNYENIGDGKIMLSWLEDNSNEEEYILIKSISGDPYDSLNNVTYVLAPNSTSFIETGLEEGVEYYFYLKAKRINALSEFAMLHLFFSENLSQTIIPPSKLSAKFNLTDSFDIRWINDNQEVEYYQLLRSINSNFVNSIDVFKIEASFSNFVDIINNNSTFYYKIRAYNISGYSEFSNVLMVDLNKLVLVEFKSEPNGINILVNGDSSITPFNVVYQDSTVLSLSAPEFFIRGLDSVYYYNEWSFSKDLENSYIVTEGTGQIQLDYFACSYPNPPSEALLDFMIINETYSTKLSWSKEFCHKAYIIERSVENGPFSIYDSIVGENHYFDNNLEPETKYNYKIFAVNHVGKSEASETLFITTPIKLNRPSNFTHVNIGDGRILLSWTDNNDKEDEYVLIKWINEDSLNSTTFTIANNSSSFIDFGLEEGEVYNYSLKAKTGELESSSANIYLDFNERISQTFPAPTNFNAQFRSMNSITISWEGSGQEIDYYQFLKSANADFSDPFTFQTLASDVNEQIDTLSLEDTFFYKIRAYNNSGYSPFSEVLKVEMGVLGIDNQQSGSALIYPNPAINWVTIDFHDKSISKVKFNVIGVDGKVVLTEESNLDVNGTIKISLSTLEPGLYFIVFETNEKVFTEKILVNR